MAKKGGHYGAPVSASPREVFCVYLGPTIRGVVQSGVLLPGTRADAEKQLAGAIAKYPDVAKLVVPDTSLAADRIKVKTPGNALYAVYRKLVGGLSNGS